MAILAKSARFRGFREKGLRPTHLFVPDTIMLDGDLVRIVKNKWFGLSKDEYEIRVSRIASVRLASGIFNSTLTVESLGARDNIFIGNLPKKEATAMAEAIRALLR